jgi:hypothetical protein
MNAMLPDIHAPPSNLQSGTPAWICTLALIKNSIAEIETHRVRIIPDQAESRPMIGEVQMLQPNGIQYSIHGARRHLDARQAPSDCPCTTTMLCRCSVHEISPLAECPKKHVRELQTVFKGLDVSGASLAKPMELEPTSMRASA